MSVTYNAIIKIKNHTFEHLTNLFDQNRIRRRGPSSEDRSKMTILYLTEHKTCEHLGKDFLCSTSAAHSIVTCAVALLAQNSPEPGLTSKNPADSLQDKEIVSELKKEGYAIVDGTFIHTQNAYLPGHFNHKHRQCGMVTLTFTTPSGKPFWFSPPQPGSVHDMTLLQQSGMLKLLEDLDVGLVADKGFQGLDTSKHLTPLKKPKNGRLTATMKEFNHWVALLRIKVETVFARLKVFKAMVKCRRKTRNVADTMKAALTLHLLDGRTW